MPTEPDITVTQLLTQQDRLRKKEQEIKSKRAKIKAFQGLPPVAFSEIEDACQCTLTTADCVSQSLDLARLELRNARNEQMKLIQLREKLLDKMADGVA
jgi:HAUS augmin-like complex subunit 1